MTEPNWVLVCDAFLPRSAEQDAALQAWAEATKRCIDLGLRPEVQYQ